MGIGGSNPSCWNPESILCKPRQSYLPATAGLLQGGLRRLGFPVPVYILAGDRVYTVVQKAFGFPLSLLLQVNKPYRHCSSFSERERAKFITHDIPLVYILATLTYNTHTACDMQMTRYCTVMTLNVLQIELQLPRK